MRIIFFNTLGFWRSCVHQLELLPAHRLGVACEYQNGEVIQVPNGGGRHDRAALIVNPKCRRIDPFSVADNLCRIRIIGHTTAEGKRLACARAAVRHVGLLHIAAQYPEPKLLSLR